MSFEPPLPLEFVVEGVAVSWQSSARSKNEWRKKVQQAAARGLPEYSWTLERPVCVTIYLFPKAPRIEGDIDNYAKTVLDALKSRVYRDDSLVERLVVQKFLAEAPTRFDDPSDALLEAMGADAPTVYVRISDDLSGE